MGVKGGMGQPVHPVVVHGQKNLSSLHGRSKVGLYLKRTPASLNFYQVALLNVDLRGIFRMQLQVGRGRRESRQHRRLGGAALGMPLTTGSPAGQQDHGIRIIWHFRHFRMGRIQQTRLAAWGIKMAIGVEPPLRFFPWTAHGIGPLDTSPGVEMIVALDTRDIAGSTTGKIPKNMENRLGVRPLREQPPATPCLRNQFEDPEIRHGLARSPGHDLGGGKAIIMGDPSIKSEALFRTFGRFVESLNGRYMVAGWSPHGRQMFAAGLEEWTTKYLVPST